MTKVNSRFHYMDEKDMDREEKNLAAFYRGLGLKWRGK